jgi:ABC-2 type transport system permease protein
VIAAILKAQLLSLRPGRTSGDLRGAVFSGVTAVIWYGFWCIFSVYAFDYCRSAPAEQLRGMLRGALFLALIYWQVVPVATATIGAALDMRKLMIYPVGRGQLFQVEAMLRAISGVEMILTLVGGAAGLMANPATGGWTAAPRLALGVVLFALFNVLLASGSRSLLQRLLARGRVRETLIIVGLCGLLLPRVMTLDASGFGRLWDAVPREDGLPWTLGAHLLTGDYALPALFGLCGWTALAALFGRWQFERSLRFDEAAAQASTPRPAASAANEWMERFYRFPGRLWGDPLAAVMEKELRSLARSPRFRMVFAMGFSFGLLVWLPLVMGRRSTGMTELGQYFLTIVTLYALTLLGQVTYWNAFGFDRSAAQIYYAAPQSMAWVLVGKNLAALVFIYLEAAILTATTFAFRIRLGAGDLAETAVVLTIASSYMLALGNISSVHYPRALNPSKVSQGGASGRFQALVFILYPCALLPIFLAYLARRLLESTLAFWALIGLAAAIGAAFYWIALESAATTAVKRREQIVQELVKGEGPVATN